MSKALWVGYSSSPFTGSLAWLQEVATFSASNLSYSCPLDPLEPLSIPDLWQVLRMYPQLIFLLSPLPSLHMIFFCFATIPFPSPLPPTSSLPAISHIYFYSHSKKDSNIFPCALFIWDSSGLLVVAWLSWLISTYEYTPHMSYSIWISSLRNLFLSSIHLHAKFMMSSYLIAE